MFFLLFFVNAVIIGFRMAFVRHNGPALWNEPPEVTERHERMAEQACALPHRVIRITSNDGLRLFARYFPAETDAKRTVILVHGYRGNGLHDHAHNVLYYHREGYNVLLPDHRAHGNSEGKYISFGVLEAEDLRLWCQYAADELCAQKIILHGVSMGASTVLIAISKKIDGLCGAVSDCAYTSGDEIIKHVSRRIMKLPFFLVLKVVILTAKIVCSADIKSVSPIKAAEHSTVPVLFIHGTCDTFVPTEMSRRLYDTCSSKKRLLLFRAAQHAEAWEAAPRRYYAEIADFLSEMGM